MITLKEIKLEDNLSWDNLINESSTATFFQTKEWLQIWVKHWGKSGEIIIYAVFDNDELIGIAPFQISDKINILGVPDPSRDGSLSDFGDIIIKSGREKEVWEVVLKKLRLSHSEHSEESRPTSEHEWDPSPAKRDQDDISFNFIREESPSFEILKKLGGKAEELEVSPCIDLPKTWDEYLATLDRHDRHEIKRKIRKIEEEHVIKVCGEIKSQNINELFRLMVASNEKKGDFLSAGMRVFLNEVIIQLGQKKLLTLCFLKYENVNIAAILILFQKKELLLYNSGFDPKYSYFSPGLILNAYAIKQGIEEGKSRFDFLRGNEKYKFDMGGKERKLYKIQI